eukprot:6477590-Amphidinium_carterae.1
MGVTSQSWHAVLYILYALHDFEKLQKQQSLEVHNCDVKLTSQSSLDHFMGTRRGFRHLCKLLDSLQHSETIGLLTKDRPPPDMVEIDFRNGLV